MPMKFAVKDYGLYVQQASSLADKGKNQVVYFSDFYDISQEYHRYAPGVNFDYLKKTKYFFDYVKDSDCLVNFDCSGNDEFIHFKEIYPEKSVFSAGLGERIENRRLEFRKLLTDCKVLQNKWELVVGIDNLRKYLKDHPDSYVKSDIFRGDSESFPARRLKVVEGELDRLAVVYTPHKNDQEFIVEEKIDSIVETGFDGFYDPTNGFQGFYGYEVDKGFVIMNTKDPLPKAIKETLEAIEPKLREMDYRGAISTEERIVDGKKHYFIDITCRLADCGSMIYSEPSLFKNFPEVVYKVGKKEKYKIDMGYKYVSALPLNSSEATDNFLYIDVDKKHLDKVKMHVPCKDKDGDYWSCPNMLGLCVVLVAGGNTIEEVKNKIKKAADYVDADSLNKEPVSCINKIDGIIAKGKQVGVMF